jgi:hypothetical protein
MKWRIGLAVATGMEHWNMQSYVVLHLNVKTHAGIDGYIALQVLTA